MVWQPLAGLCLAAALLSGAACNDGDEGFDPAVDQDRGAITVTPVQPNIQVPGQINPRTREIVILDDRLDPPQIELTANVATELQVANRGGTECRFFLGDFVQPTAIPAGETRGLSFAATATDTRSGDMGCDGDENRQGSFTIEQRGVPTAP